MRKKNKELNYVKPDIFENKKTIRSYANRRLEKNIIFAEDVYVNIDIAEDIYGKSNFVYGNMLDIRKYFIEPNILLNNMSYIIKDYDGLLYSKYKNTFEEEGYTVKNINFIDTMNSFKYNPFDYFNYEEDVIKFVGLLIDTNREGMSDSEILIKNAEKFFLESLLYYVMLELPHDEHKMSTVNRLIQLAKPRNKIKEEYRSDLRLLFKVIEKEKDKDENIALQKFNGFLQCAKHLEKTIIENVEKYLAIYSMPSISQICENNSINIEDIIENKQIIFVISPSNTNKYERISDTFICQTIDYLYYLADAKYGGKLPNPIHIMATKVLNPLINDYIMECCSKNVIISCLTDRILEANNIYGTVYDLMDKCSALLCFDYENEEIEDYINQLVTKRFKEIALNHKKDVDSKEICVQDCIYGTDYVDCLIFLQYAKAIRGEVFNVERFENYKEMSYKSEKYFLKETKDALASQIYNNLLTIINDNLGMIKEGENVNIDIGNKRFIEDDIYRNITMKVDKSIYKE